MNFFAFYSLCLLLATGFYRVQAQEIAAADSSTAAAVRAATQRYHAATLADSRLLSGTDYVNRTKPYVQGSPFFPVSEVQLGSVRYDGFAYAAVPMRYDCQRDQLVVQPPGRAISLQLVPEKVATFTLAGHRFVRLVTDSVANPQVRTGFYDLLVDGPARLLARHHKKSYERPTPAGMEGHFEQTTRYVVQHHDAYYPVTRLKDVLAAFPDQKAALQKFVRKQHLSFGEGLRQYSLTALVGYYNTLR
ncbi:hypothetical protein [Hymenobacter psoromatis]|uniref:hypothetical protein n=1 Tax=Hymenobacter psoromatis TaxID=1484116 RepID=UPI001CBF0120|nr:hypothetical protein [Hymenobacter psoromatis]